MDMSLFGDAHPLENYLTMISAAFAFLVPCSLTILVCVNCCDNSESLQYLQRGLMKFKDDDRFNRGYRHDTRNRRPFIGQPPFKRFYSDEEEFDRQLRRSDETLIDHKCGNGTNVNLDNDNNQKGIPSRDLTRTDSLIDHTPIKRLRDDLNGINPSPPGSPAQGRPEKGKSLFEDQINARLQAEELYFNIWKQLEKMENQVKK